MLNTICGMLKLWYMFKVLLTILRVELCLLISKTNSSSIRGVKHGEVVGIGTCGREG